MDTMDLAQLTPALRVMCVNYTRKTEKEVGILKAANRELVAKSPVREHSVFDCSLFAKCGGLCGYRVRYKKSNPTEKAIRQANGTVTRE